MKLGFFCFIIIFMGISQLWAQQELTDAQQQYDAGNYDAVILILSEVNENAVDFTATNVMLLADAYSQTQQWDKAIPLYERLVETDQEVANYQYKYGGALAMKALTVNTWRAIPLVLEAKTAFLKAADLDKNHIDTRWALVKVYTELPGILGGSITKAIQYANQLEALSKVDGYLAKGYVYEYEAQNDLAEQFYKQALETGGSKTCYLSLAQFYINTDKTQKAIVILNEGFKRLNDISLQQKIEEISQ